MSNIQDIHSYARKAMDEQLVNNWKKMDEELKKASTTDASGTAIQPNRPSKKSKTLASAEDDDRHISNAHIFAAMERIERLQMKTLKGTHSVENTVKEVKDTLDGMGKQMEEITKVQTLEMTVTALQKEKAELREKCDKLEAYRRRWNLRVAGIPETTSEDTRKIITDLFGQVSPGIKEQLELTVDVAHQLGPRSGEQRSSRNIIVLFISRAHRDRIWRDARTAMVLKERKIRVFEDLTQQLKDARNKLWPQVEQARKEGKRAGFRGPFAYRWTKSDCVT
ncbi:uncharacterized protein LOC126404357 [Epinephelus moara]|uniref:uncharacterized protein LOC126404357 n=1 Tax=Epinephelus moara TaxID=300413 RepID=UPI00214F4EF5|nr:uncharacterized protein LOC126404357 [Epinephelus moara]